MSFLPARLLLVNKTVNLSILTIIRRKRKIKGKFWCEIANLKSYLFRMNGAYTWGFDSLLDDLELYRRRRVVKKFGYKNYSREVPKNFIKSNKIFLMQRLSAKSAAVKVAYSKLLVFLYLIIFKNKTEDVLCNLRECSQEDQ